LVTHTNLNQEVSQVFFELWDVLIKAEQSLNEHFDLCTTEQQATHIHTKLKTTKDCIKNHQHLAMICNIRITWTCTL